MCIRDSREVEPGGVLRRALHSLDDGLGFDDSCEHENSPVGVVDRAAVRGRSRCLGRGADAVAPQPESAVGSAWRRGSGRTAGSVRRPPGLAVRASAVGPAAWDVERGDPQREAVSAGPS